MGVVEAIRGLSFLGLHNGFDKNLTFGKAFYCSPIVLSMIYAKMPKAEERFHNIMLRGTAFQIGVLEDELNHLVKDNAERKKFFDELEARGLPISARDAKKGLFKLNMGTRTREQWLEVCSKYITLMNPGTYDFLNALSAWLKDNGSEVDAASLSRMCLCGLEEKYRLFQEVCEKAANLCTSPENAHEKVCAAIKIALASISEDESGIDDAMNDLRNLHIRPWLETSDMISQIEGCWVRKGYGVINSPESHSLFGMSYMLLTIAVATGCVEAMREATLWIVDTFCGYTFQVQLDIDKENIPWTCALMSPPAGNPYTEIYESDTCRRIRLLAKGLSSVVYDSLSIIRTLSDRSIGMMLPSSGIYRILTMLDENRENDCEMCRTTYDLIDSVNSAYGRLSSFDEEILAEAVKGIPEWLTNIAHMTCSKPDEILDFFKC